MDRRKFLTLTGGAAVAFSLRAASVKQPNIVLVVGDDMTYTDAGCYGNPDVRTPNIDRLAEQGMRFTRCFTATPMCSPTRQMIYTGLFPVKSGAYPNHAEVKPGVRGVVHYLRDLGYRVALAGKRHYGPSESFPFEEISDKPLDFSNFEEFLTRDRNQPFCLMVTSNQPHTPWNLGDASAYDPDKLAVPPYMVDTPETRRGLAKYYGEITFLDEQLGRVMNLIADNGLEDDTLLMFTSEQGSNFAHCKWTLYDTGIRTQLIARWPGRIEAGSMAHAMVQYCDLVPTWIEAAGGEAIQGLDGRSFLGVLEGRTDRHRDEVYALQTTRGIFSGSECYPIRAVRDGRYKLIWNLNSAAAFSNTVIAAENSAEGHFASWRERAKTDPDAAEKVRMYEFRPAEELYDLEADPYEINNIAGDPKRRPIIEAMKRKLEAWMIEQGDRGIETEMEAIAHQNPLRREL